MWLSKSYNHIRAVQNLIPREVISDVLRRLLESQPVKSAEDVAMLGKCYNVAKQRPGCRVRRSKAMQEGGSSDVDNISIGFLPAWLILRSDRLKRVRRGEPMRKTFKDFLYYDQRSDCIDLGNRNNIRSYLKSITMLILLAKIEFYSKEEG